MNQVYSGTAWGSRMRSDREVFETDALLRVEQVYRRRLQADPSDLPARTGLAWCLFMQALHQAGQERVLAALSPESEPRAAAAPAGKLASDLLRDCLKQAMTVMQLSGDPVQQSEVGRLATLVRLSGGEEAVTAAEHEAAAVLAEVTRAVLAVDETPRFPRRRIRLRPRQPGGS